MENDRIPVLDDFGRVIGWFIPARDGGCAAALAWIVVIAIVAAVFFPIWLIWKGCRLWETNQKDAAFLAWSVGIGMVLIPTMLILNQQHAKEVHAQQQKEERAIWEASRNEAFAAIPQSITVTSVLRSTYRSGLGTYTSLEITIRNNGRWPVHIDKIYWPREGFHWRNICTVWGHMGTNLYPGIPGGSSDVYSQNPNTTKVYTCGTGHPPDQFAMPPAICLEVFLWITGEFWSEYNQPSQELCFPLQPQN